MYKYIMSKLKRKYLIDILLNRLLFYIITIIILTLKQDKDFYYLKKREYYLIFNLIFPYIWQTSTNDVFQCIHRLQRMH